MEADAFLEWALPQRGLRWRGFRRNRRQVVRRLHGRIAALGLANVAAYRGDIGLPVMDGYRLAELLRATYDIPLVAITGFGQDSDRERALTSGFAAHLVKPVDLSELAELVTRLGES